MTHPPATDRAHATDWQLPGAHNALSVSGLTKAFGTTVVLQGVDLAVPGGCLAAVLGPSGSGKTTLLRTLAGFERPDRGTVAIGGAVVDDHHRHQAPEHRGIGYVPQDGSLFPHLRVRENVAFGLPRRDRARVDSLLDLVGLGGLGHRHPHQLSGGQQQRVALARALAVDPAIVLLDEPFSSLDAAMRAEVRADVRQVLVDTATTAILVTHDQDEALSFADLVAVIRDGRIAQAGPPRDVYNQPADPSMAQFLGEANLVAGAVRRAPGGLVVRTLLGDLEIRATRAAERMRDGTEVISMIRPEQLELLWSPDGTGEPPSEGCPGWQGRVASIDYHGHDAVVRVAGAGLELTVRVPGRDQVVIGAAVRVRVRGPVPIWEGPAAGPAGAG